MIKSLKMSTNHFYHTQQHTVTYNASFFAGLYQAYPNADVWSLHTDYSDAFIPKSVSYKAPKHLGQLYDPTSKSIITMMS